MPTYRMIGGNEYRQQINEGRNALKQIRLALGKMQEAGELTRLALQARASNELVKALETLDELDKIGQRAKNLQD